MLQFFSGNSTIISLGICGDLQFTTGCKGEVIHREKRQNRITEQRKIQKEICRILLIFTMILSMICVVNLTGCRDRKSQEQTELISLDGREPDVEKADGNTAKEAEESEAGTDDNMTEKAGLKQEKLQICYVHVCGAVKSPGVYELTSDSRLYEAIQMAGGFTDEAAGEALNQAEKIEDGSRIYVPTKEEAKAGTENNGTFVQNADNEKTDATKSTDAGSTADGKVDINTAGKDELMTLSGIGEAKADAIIRYRDEHGKFQKIEDLMEVEGIKDGVFQKVKDQIKI